MAIMTWEQIQKQWDNLSEPEKFDIMGYISALLTNSTNIDPQTQQQLQKRLDEFNQNQSAIAWNQLYNDLIKQLI